jgi:hypothetical protein
LGARISRLDFIPYTVGVRATIDNRRFEVVGGEALMLRAEGATGDDIANPRER